MRLKDPSFQFLIRNEYCNGGGGSEFLFIQACYKYFKSEFNEIKEITYSEIIEAIGYKIGNGERTWPSFILYVST